MLCYELTDKVLLVNHTPKSKVDDRYNNEIHEIIEQKGESQKYVVKGIETEKLRSVHRDNIIPFKQDCVRINPVKVENIKSWHQLNAKPAKHQSTIQINKSINQKISTYYGYGDETKVDHQVLIPTVITKQSVDQVFTEANQTTVIDLGCGKLKKRSICTIL